MQRQTIVYVPLVLASPGTVQSTTTACHGTTAFTPGVAKFQRLQGENPGQSTKMSCRG